MASGGHLLVVIDHREAWIYKTDTPGSQLDWIAPDDPHGFDRELRYDQNVADGKRRPERKSDYEAIAKSLRVADSILLFGESSAMHHLLKELKHAHGDLAKHFVGSVAIDEKHLTEGELMAKARAYRASIAH